MIPEHHPEEPARICEGCFSAIYGDFYADCAGCGAAWTPSPERLWRAIASIRHQLDGLRSELDEIVGPS